MKQGPHPRQKLTALGLKKLSKPGRYADGNCLHLLVDHSGAKRWILRLTIKGKRTDMSLGSLDLVTLAEAREKAIAFRRSARDGKDPIAERRAQKRQQLTFQEAAEQVHREKLPTFRNDKHAAQWISSLKMYAFPKIGALRIDAVTTTDLANVLLPIWHDKHETASRLRQRIALICKWAKAHGYTTNDPSDDLGPTLPKVKASKSHFQALDYREVPDLIAKLKNGPGSEAAKLGIELIMLTCLRTSEVRLGEWSEVDWEQAIWTIPAVRQQKTDLPEEHVVPLTSRALDILRRLQVLSDGSVYMFPGRGGNQPVSNMTFLMAIRRLGAKTTIHGLRATVRTWAEEETDHHPDILEKALAHTIKDKVQAAYRRGSLLEKRRKFMEDWQAYTQASSYQGWKNAQSQRVAS